MSKVLKVAAIVVGVAALALTVVGAAGFAGAALAAGISSALGGISAATLGVISMGLSIGAQLLAKKPKAPAETINRLTATFDTQAPRKMVCGTTAMATDVRYQGYTGTNQDYLNWILALAAHEVASVDRIYFDSDLAWSSVSGVASKYAGYLEVTVRNPGSSSNAIAIDSAWNGSARLTGCAYLYIRFKLTGNTDKAQSPFSSSVPTRVTVIGNGIKVYDPRLDSTNGGSGPQRPDDQSTWTFGSGGRNPALQALTYLLGWRINGKVSVGRGVPASRIDVGSFITAANLCDESVSLSVGGTEPRYRADAVFSEADSPDTVLGSLNAAMNAVMRDASGRLSINVVHNDLAVPVAAFTENDILADEVWRQTAPLSQTFNVVRGRYVDPSAAALFQPVDYPEVNLSPIDGIDRIDTLDLLVVQSASQAQRLAKQRLQRTQYQGTYSATLNARAWQVNLGDVVTLSHSSMGWANKLFRVISMGIGMDGRVPVALLEEHPDIYAWDAAESPAVQAAVPTTYDPTLHPFVQAIDEASQTALWDNITGSGKPQDDATRNVNRGAWSYPTAYEVGDIVTYGGAAYTVNVAHTSSVSSYPPSSNFVILVSGSGGAGPPGLPALAMRLSVPSSQVPAYANGNLATFSIETAATVFSGTTDVTGNFSISIPTGGNPQGLTTVVDTSAKTVTVTGAGTSTGQLGNVGQDIASLTIRMSGTGAYAGSTQDSVLTLTKLKGGYEIASANPTTGNFEGRVVYNSTDGKLYTYHSGAFVATINTASTINGSQLAAATLDATKFAGSIAPVGIISGTPGAYQGPLVYSSTNNLTYRWDPVTGSYVRLVVTTDTIPATNVGAGLTDAQISALSAAKITGQLVSSQLAITVGGGNLLNNSSFEYTAGATLAPGFGLYTNGGEAYFTPSIVAGRLGGKAQQVAWPTNVNQKGIYLTSQGGIDNTGIWKPNTTYMWSFYVKASGAAVGTTMETAWNVAPANGSGTWISNPPLTTNYQRYVVKMVWGASVDANGFLTVASGTANGVSTLTFDDMQIEEGDVATAYAPKVGEILSGAISSTMISDLAATKITGALTDSQLSAIAAAKITGQIVSTQITDGSISTAKIAAGAVTASQIAADTITAAQIAAGAITASELAAGSVVTSKLAAGAVTANEIAANTITSSQIAARSILTGSLAAGAITAYEIAALTITANELAANSVTTAKIAAGAVTAGQIAANTITAAQIAADTITAGQIAAGAISASELAAGAIVTSKLLVTDRGNNMIADPNGRDLSAWTDGGSNSTLTALASTTSPSGTALYITGSPYVRTANTIQIDAYKNYNLKMWGVYYAGAGTTAYLVVEALDQNGTGLGSGSFPSNGTYNYFGLTGTAVQPGWTEYQVSFGPDETYHLPSGTTQIRIGILANYNGVSGAATGLTGMRLVEKISANLVVDGAIVTTKIAAGAITTSKLAANAVTANEISAGAITTAKIAASAVTANEIAAYSITSSKISANTIVASHFITDQGVDLAAIVPSTINWRLSFSDPTDLGPYGFGQSANTFDTGVVAISGTGTVTTATIISTAPTSTLSTTGSPTDNSTTLEAYYRINGGSWVLIGTMYNGSSIAGTYFNNSGIADVSPTSSGTLQFGYRMYGTYSGSGNYTSLDRSLAFKVVNWK